MPLTLSLSHSLSLSLCITEQSIGRPSVLFLSSLPCPTSPPPTLASLALAPPRCLVRSVARSLACVESSRVNAKQSSASSVIAAVTDDAVAAAHSSSSLTDFPPPSRLPWQSGLLHGHQPPLPPTFHLHPLPRQRLHPTTTTRVPAELRRHPPPTSPFHPCTPPWLPACPSRTARRCHHLCFRRPRLPPTATIRLLISTPAQHRRSQTRTSLSSPPTI